MKKGVLILIVCLLLLASNVFAADVSIDQDGNITTGLSSSGNLEVIGSSGEDGIIGSTSGTGASGVFGENTTYGNFGILGGFYDIYDVGVYGYSSSGFAGYFDGDIRVTGNLTTDGMIESTNGGIKFPDGTIQTTAGTGASSSSESGKKITAVHAGIGLSGGGTSGEVTLDVDFIGTGSADTASRSDHNHDLFYSLIFHNHSGSDITSGTISEPRIDSEIARFNEIMPTILGSDGAGSEIDADLLDGKHASEIISQASGSGVPSGFSIMSELPTAPAGYTFTGEIVYPGIGGWNQKADMPTNRYSLATAAVNGRIYAIGGRLGQASEGIAVNEEYDPATDTWTLKAPMPTLRYGHQAATVNGKIYAIGGYGSNAILTTNEEYDPLTDTWTLKAPMPTCRQKLTVTAVNGKIYAIGGTGCSADCIANEEYDPLTDTWTSKAPIPECGHEHAAATVNGKIYIFGGNRNFHFAYDPSTDTWASIALSNNLYPFTAAAVNGRIYSIGDGYNEEYAPLTDSWTSKAPMPTRRTLSSTVSVNQKIYTIGGYLSYPTPQSLKINEEYSTNKYYVYIKN